jgi:PIN domain
VLRLLIDTCTWLDIARRRDGQKWIVPIRVFVHQNRLELLVPSVILEEFERNRPNVEASVTTSVHERFKQLRKDVQSYGGDIRYQWLEEMSHQIPLISSTALQNFRDVHELLINGRKLEPASDETSLVVERGLAHQAPFKRNKNSTADALIIEQYPSDHAPSRYRFVLRFL